METDKDQTVDIEILRSRLDRLEKAQNYANKVVQENNHLRDELYQVYRSGSWRLTAPLRKITALLRALKAFFQKRG
ncbi:MAG: hypothetical protein ACYSTR_05300 [Planctomycetota bacterium]|jgi:hypothetical protein